MSDPRSTEETDRASIVAPSFVTVARSFAERVARDLGPRVVGRDEEIQSHLLAAVEWLKRAHDATRDGGVSQGYYLLRGVRYGWLPSYRETSGYIAETLFDVAERLADEDARTRARGIVEWLVTVQNADGSYSNPHFSDGGIVFDTGQVLMGLVRGYRETSDATLLNAAERAGRWLVQSMDPDGAWRKNTHNACVHTYNVRVAWALLQLHQIAPDESLKEAARRNLRWTTEQEHDGWFGNNGFSEGSVPFTHNIAYAIRGVLEASELLDDDAGRALARRCAEAVLPHVRHDGFVPGQIDETGRGRSSSCCLTGNCQLSIIWSKLYRALGDERFHWAAKRSLGYVLRTQDLRTADLNVKGAIAGSMPIVGRYSTLGYPNWACKFFIDALMCSLEPKPR